MRKVASKNYSFSHILRRQDFPRSSPLVITRVCGRCKIFPSWLLKKYHAFRGDLELSEGEKGEAFEVIGLGEHVKGFQKFKPVTRTFKGLQVAHEACGIA